MPEVPQQPSEQRQDDNSSPPTPAEASLILQLPPVPITIPTPEVQVKGLTTSGEIAKMPEISPAPFDPGGTNDPGLAGTGK